MSWWQRQAMLGAGAQAPDFTLSALDGGTRSLKEILARGPAVVAFFKVSCPVCQLTFPYLERLHRGGSQLQIVGVSQDKAGPTREFNREFGVTFPVYLDDPKHYAASNAYGLSIVPSVFLIEPEGRISAAFAGFSKRDLEAVGERAGVKPFQPNERVPEFRPG